MALLSGYKTYGVAAIVVLIGLAEGLLGWDIPGVEVGSDWLGFIFAGMGLGSLRAAVAKQVL